MTQLTLFESAPEEHTDEKIFRCLTWADAVKFCLEQFIQDKWTDIMISKMLPDGSRWVRLTG